MAPHFSTIDQSDDTALRERVVQFLGTWQRLPLQRIDVAASGGTVTLSGVVGSFYEKQLCLSCSKRVAGVVRLVDRIRVAEA